MKRLLYIVPIALLACEQPDHQDVAYAKTDSTEVVADMAAPIASTLEMKVKVTNNDSFNSLAIFKDFSENYSPAPILGVAKLPDLPNDVLSAMRVVKSSQPEEFEKYLTLIFVKLYSAHLECCHQSYELRKQNPRGIDPDRDPLVYEFNTLSNYFPTDKPVEFIPSSIGFDYVESHPYLLEFEPIKKHIELINGVHKNMESGTY